MPMIKRNGVYYNGRGERIRNPEAYLRAIKQDKHGYNSNQSYNTTRSKYYGGSKF